MNLVDQNQQITIDPNDFNKNDLEFAEPVLQHDDTVTPETECVLNEEPGTLELEENTSSPTKSVTGSGRELGFFWCGPKFSTTLPSEKTSKKGSKENTDSDSERQFYDLKGYENVLLKLQHSKKYQDLMIKVLNARAKIEKTYADSLLKWRKVTEKEISSLEIYHHDRLFFDMILSRDTKISKATSLLSQQILNIACTFRKKSDVFFGSQKGGTLENVKDLNAKFRVAQKHWMSHLNQIENARSLLASNSINILKMESKFKEMTTLNPNLEAPKNKKMATQIEASKSEQAKLNEKYSLLHSELEEEKEVYINMMAEQYQSFVNIEKKRSQFNLSQLINYFKKLELTSKEISLASLYEDVKECLDELDPSKDYIKFCEEKGAFGYLQIPVEEDIVGKINKASQDIAANSSTMSTKATKGKPPALKIETIVGKSSEMKSETPRPDIDFTLKKTSDSIQERSKKADDQSDKLTKESKVNAEKSLNIEASIEEHEN